MEARNKNEKMWNRNTKLCDGGTINSGIIFLKFLPSAISKINFRLTAYVRDPTSCYGNSYQGFVLNECEIQVLSTIHEERKHSGILCDKNSSCDCRVLIMEWMLFDSKPPIIRYLCCIKIVQNILRTLSQQIYHACTKADLSVKLPEKKIYKSLIVNLLWSIVLIMWWVLSIEMVGFPLLFGTGTC